MVTKTTGIRIAVISDLHVGDMAKGKDFSPDKTENASVENYLEDFLSFVSKNDMSADYLVVSGDISNKAKEQEFSLASSLIEKIARALSVDRQKILFCPGNHDIDWAAMTAQAEAGASPEMVVKAKHLSFLKSGFLFSDNHKLGVGSFDEMPYLVQWSFDDLNIFSLNSAVYEGPETRPHRGEIKSDQIERLDKLLSEKVDKSKINVFILHHHPKQYHDKTFREADTSGMINADGLLHVLSKHEVDFVVHGHKHIPRFDLEINSHGHPVWILCAGSFSSRLDDRYFGSVGNFFHLIEFHDRCKENGWARGIVKSWAHLLGHKWIESGSIDFDSSNQFGAYLSPKKLGESLERCLSAVFAGAQMAEWGDLLLADESIQYYPNDMLKKELEKASKKMGLLAVYSDALQSFRTLILVKDKAL